MSEAVAPDLGGVPPWGSEGVPVGVWSYEKSDFNVSCNLNNSLLAAFNHLFHKYPSEFLIQTLKELDW
jgi:hypothetical protein